MAAVVENEECAEDDITNKISERNVNNFIPLVEDVAEWLSLVFKSKITVDNIMNELDNGVLVCKLAEKVSRVSEQHFAKNKVKNGVPLPAITFQCHEAARKESFLARENAANFLRWCKEIGIQESTLFESEGLVLHRQQRNVILTLMELGRIGEKYGMNPVPNLLKLESDIKEEEEKMPKLVKDAPIKSKKAPDKIDEQVQRIAGKYHVKLDRIKEGKYILNDKLTIFVRILRRHVMVRVGGGWDEFEHFLSRHDPKKIGKILLSV